jgi:hypothetical protein
MAAGRMRPARSPSPLVEILVEGRPLGGAAILGAGAFLALDRPDRLEIRSAIQPAAAACIEPHIVPGRTLCMVLGGCAVLEGTVDRVAWGTSAREGRCLSAVAYSSYHGLRLRHGTRTYHQVTDSELAERVAAFLGLVSVVDRTESVHPRVLVEGDPLAFLRSRAKACGFHLAVTAGRLYFTRTIPEAEELISPAAGAEILEVDVLDRAEGPGRRGGRLKVTGDPRWRPLAGFELKGLAPAMDGRYRVLRALHRVHSGGYETVVEFLEDGLDLTSWMDGSDGRKK